MLPTKELTATSAADAAACVRDLQMGQSAMPECVQVWSAVDERIPEDASFTADCAAFDA